MNKRWYRRMLVMILLLVSVLETGLSIQKLNVKYEEEQVNAENISNNAVILGGMPVGIYMKTKGVLILGTDKVESIDGLKYEPAKRLLKEGDYIVGINGEEIATKNELVIQVANLVSEDVILQIRREGEEIEVKMKAVEVDGCKYKLGVWVKDSMQGLGTITYLKEDGTYGALGHGIYDVDNSGLLEMKDGRLYYTKILGVNKGVKGTPGGIEGVIIYNSQNYLGSIEKNTDIGVYGKVEEIEDLVEKKEIIPVANKKQIELGKAMIYCTIEDEVEAFEIEIEQIDFYSREKNKGMVIRITDEKLLEKTGGIVQGMSGSPIIQDGKLVGAVTHVLVNDPTRGYGIFIENMLDAVG